MTIVGGGASGLISAILLARDGYSITLLERQKKVARKILASGNGRCNIGNVSPTIDHYHSSNPPFIKALLDGYSASDIISLFSSLGIHIIEGADGKLFPMSLQASSVVEIVMHEIEALDIEIIYGCEVLALSQRDGLFVLETTQGEMLSSHLLIASGSEASPQLGGNRSGIAIASALGHNEVPSMPSLVQLTTDEKWVSRASGVKIESLVKLYADGDYITQREGDILFTDYGVSGLAILDISRSVSEQLASYSYCELSIDIVPHITKEQLRQIFLSYVDSKSRKPIEIWLMGFVNKKLISTIIEQSKSRVSTLSELNTKEINRLVYTIKNLKLSISGTRGFKGAEVATGGVDTRDIDPQTMESKIVKNLYFAGEVVDVDGDRGGFNFHFAWVSAMRVADGYRSSLSTQ
ncbi:NAD(FAD)-utilizing dehydrogenases [hydrothermal vent metagenome]|uniref:NAD(FAD)-utilizing dehydrogenases n=1 Tax=hydrothermal vent metagenome TaxID=652676 RepID=A0A1W1BIZ7_9ZZZZ